MKSNARHYLLVAAIVTVGYLTGGEGTPFLVAILFVFLTAMFLVSIKPENLSPARYAVNILLFLWDFFMDMVISNLRLARDILTPGDRFNVELIEIPVADLTPRELSFLDHRITLTPGTLSCGLSENKDVLIVHVLYSVEGEDMRKILRRPMDILKGRKGES